MYHEQLGIITFSYCYTYEEDKGQGPTYIIQVPMSFKSKVDCKMFFKKYLRHRNEGKGSLSMLEFHVSWPRDTYENIIEHKTLKLQQL